jgi:hypothetical protein
MTASSSVAFGRASRVVQASRLMACAIVLAASATGLTAQEAISRDAASEVRTQFTADLDTLQSKFLALAGAFPEGKFSWRPKTGVRSVGEVFMHVASEYYVYTPMAYGAPASPAVGKGPDAFQKFEQSSTKADVLKHLNEGFAYAKQTLAALDPAALAGKPKLFGKERTIVETSIIMTADLHEHLGQLIAYARMNDVKPPWSK